MELTASAFYSLNPIEFEELCVKFLETLGYSDLKITDGPFDNGIDIIGKADGKKVAVQVKHSRNLNKAKIQETVNQIKRSDYQPNKIIFITSAHLTKQNIDSIEKSFDEIDFKLFGPSDLIKILNKHPEIKQSLIAPAQKRNKMQNWKFRIGIIGSFASIIGFMLSAGILFFDKHKEPLGERIETVELAINNLKDLEQHLTDIKKDMEETQQAKIEIEKEYEKAKELKSLTDEQFEAVRSVLNSQGWSKILLNALYGFILGVASSLMASVIYAKWQQKRALSK